MWESRLKGPPPTTGPFLAGRAASLDVDLSTKTKDDFEVKTWRAGTTLANEIGSVHRSFCSDEEGCELFALWGLGRAVLEGRLDAAAAAWMVCCDPSGDDTP